MASAFPCSALLPLALYVQAIRAGLVALRPVFLLRAGEYARFSRNRVGTGCSKTLLALALCFSLFEPAGGTLVGFILPDACTGALVRHDDRVDAMDDAIVELDVRLLKLRIVDQDLVVAVGELKLATG